MAPGYGRFPHHRDYKRGTPRTWQAPNIASAVSHRETLLEAHQANKQILLAEVQRQTGQVLNPDALLIGFARRAATYKRADLIFRNQEELLPLLESGRIQLVFSGKAHPQDDGGKNMVANIVALAKELPGKGGLLRELRHER